MDGVENWQRQSEVILIGANQKNYMKVLGWEIKREKKTGLSPSEQKAYFDLRKRYYEAADKGRRGKAFARVKSTGPNIEIVSALTELRSRSRHMVRNNGWAKRAVEAIVKNTVGEGIRPAPLGTISVNKKVKTIWREWAETTACDWYGKSTFYGLQEMAMRSIAEGGDIIVILRRTQPQREDELPIKIQLCEGDMIDHSKNGVNEQGVARLGVQYSNEGELLGYWLWDSHPGDMGFYGLGLRQSEFHKKEDILHVFEILRIGQSRGLPFGVAGFMKMSDFSDYEDAQLFKQKVAAMFCAFVTGNEESIPEEGIVDKMEPGMIEYLGLGEEIAFANPPTVGDYDTYSTRILQGVASSYGITYEMLTMDFSRVNFTSGRMAFLTVINNFRSWQYGMMVPQFCQPIWEWFMDACLVAGFLHKRVKTDFTAPRIQHLDPVKETNAMVLQIQAGLTTWSETVRELGRDPIEFIEEVKQEREMLIAAGINFSSIILAPDIPEEPANNQNNNNEQEKNQ